MERLRSIVWRYWLAMDVLIAGMLAGCPVAPSLAIALGIVQTIHFAARTQSLTAFQVQVRAAYLALLAAGFWPPLEFIHWVQLAGTTAFVTAGYCPLARMLALLPWNRQQPLTPALVWRAFATPPVRGSIVQALAAR